MNQSLNNCPGCGASLPSAKATSPKIQCSYCHSFVPNPAFNPDAPVLATVVKPKPPPRVERTRPAAPHPSPRQQPGRGLLGEIIGGMLGGLIRKLIFAGLIISFILFGTPMLALLSIVSCDRESRYSHGRDKDDALLERMIVEVAEAITSQGEIFDDQAGNTFLANKQRDRWNKPFQYEQSSEREFRVRSAGKDGIMKTSDDDWGTHRVAANLVAKSVSKPDSFEQADDMLRRSVGYYRKTLAMDWMIQNHEQVPADQKEPLLQMAVEASYRMGDNAELRVASLIDTLVQNANAQADWVETCAEHRLYNAATVLLQKIAAAEAYQQLYRFYNFPVKTIYLAAEQELDRLQISNTDRMDICKKDLHDSLRRSKAVMRLSEHIAIAETSGSPLSESQITELGRLVFRHLGETAKRSTSRRRISIERPRSEEFAARLEAFVTDESIDALCKSYAETEDYIRELSEVLAGIDDIRVADVLVRTMFTPGIKGGCSQKALKLKSPKIESKIWPMLKERSSYHQARACEVLGEIGSMQSLEYIQPLTQSSERDVREAAQNAINAITSARRDPAA